MNRPKTNRSGEQGEGHALVALTPREAITVAESAMSRRRLTATEQSLIAHLIALAHRAATWETRAATGGTPKSLETR